MLNSQTLLLNSYTPITLTPTLLSPSLLNSCHPSVRHPHSWHSLSSHTSSLSLGHTLSRQVDYFNGEGSFKDKNTVEVIAKDGTSVSYHGNTHLNNVCEYYHLSIQKAITADTIVVAVGLRPRYPDVGVC